MSAKRERHTAPYLLSHFLCSNDQFEFKLTSTDISILRYMYDVMEMNYHKIGKCICDIPIAQIARFSGNALRTTKRSLPNLVKNKLITMKLKQHRKPSIYEMGEIIVLRATAALKEDFRGPQRHSNWCHGGTPIREDKKDATPFEGGGYEKPQKSLDERLVRLQERFKH